MTIHRWENDRYSTDCVLLSTANRAAYLVINNSWTQTTTVELPGEAEVYALTGNGKMRSRTMLLNGKELTLGENDELPELNGVSVSGKVEVAPGSCTFLVL